MHKYLIFTILLAMILISHGCLDQKQKQVQSQKRIISLSPHITEIIYALGSEDELVAVSDFCRFPPAAGKKEKIGGLINPNIEKIVSLRPTLLIGVPSHTKLNDELAKFQLSVIMLPNENISDVLATIDTIGTLLDRKDNAALLIKNIKDSLSAIKTENGMQRPRATLVIGRERGTLKNITAVGEDTFINEVWEIAGGINIFSDLPARYSAVNLETILTRNPEVIIEFDIDGVPDIRKTNDAKIWKQLDHVSATANGKVFTVTGSHTLIPGPRLVLLARQFRTIINRISLDTGK
ncbi:MAG: ABC transporter substrate-binding protein [Calditrichae bacterium]|nr:ABC transporter substrate-binding protein [Calditrichia bacterium]